MLKHLLPLPLLAMAVSAYAADVYKWTDESGRVNYTDRYKDGAERVTVQGGVSSAAVNPPSDAAAHDTPGEDAAYRNLAIASPAADSVHDAGAGKGLQVSVLLEPGLHDGHAVALLLDGAQLGERMPATQFLLKDLAPGTHSIQATVYDKGGRQLAAAEPVTFHVKPAVAP